MIAAARPARYRRSTARRCCSRRASRSMPWRRPAARSGRTWPRGAPRPRSLEPAPGEHGRREAARERGRDVVADHRALRGVGDLVSDIGPASCVAASPVAAAVRRRDVADLELTVACCSRPADRSSRSARGARRCRRSPVDGQAGDEVVDAARHGVDRDAGRSLQFTPSELTR